VLLVDDNPFNLVAASFIVSKLGLKSQTAANGKEAIERLQESMNSGQYFSFILMDIQMPIMDGIQATKAINQMIQRRELYPVPVIALTAKKIDSQEKKIYKECGMFDALGKPLIEQELQNIIKKFSTNR
jgi:CheY-like chemotaxis protein